MTKEQLQDRIQKTTEKINKIEKRIKKWQDAQNEKACIKSYNYMLSWGKTEQQIIDQYYGQYIKSCNWELDRAVQDLHDSQLTLEKYQNALNMELAKENEFENNRINVIWDFLLNYKEQVAQYIRENMKGYCMFKSFSSSSCSSSRSSKVRVLL